MPTTYEEYLQMPKSLPFNEMQELHAQILSGIDTDTEAQELYDELVGASITYASIRAKWLTLTIEEKASTDSRRYLDMHGIDTAWRDVLGDEKEDPNNRKRIGDFGCYLAFVNALAAR